MEDRGEIDPATVREFDQASKGKTLPEHVSKHSKKDRPSMRALKAHKG